MPKLTKVLRWMGRNRTLCFGAAILLLITITSVLAPLLTPHDPKLIVPMSRLKPPGFETHLLGTDSLGRDQFARLLYGGRISLMVGICVVLITGVIGTLLGVISGYSQRVELVLMRILDGMMAFPGIILAIALVAVLGPRISNIIVALSIVNIPRMARVARSAVITVRRSEYVQAAEAMGARDGRIIWFHVLPNCLGPIIVQATVILAGAILSEASLSFLGVSGDPESPSWGLMLSEARQYIYQAPWMSIWPGIWIILTVLALNMLGDGLRDLTDPRLKSR